MPDGTSLGKIDQQAAVEGSTEPLVGTYTFQFTKDDFHLLPQPLFYYLPLQDPAVSLKFAANRTWQAQFGWTLFKDQFEFIGHRFDLSFEQSVARQFGAQSKERQVIFNLLQGQLKLPIESSRLYFFAEGTFSGSRNDADGKWKGQLEGAAGIGFELDIVFKRAKK